MIKSLVKPPVYTLYLCKSNLFSEVFNLFNTNDQTKSLDFLKHEISDYSETDLTQKKLYWVNTAVIGYQAYRNYQSKISEHLLALVKDFILKDAENSFICVDITSALISINSFKTSLERFENNISLELQGKKLTEILTEKIPDVLKKDKSYTTIHENDLIVLKRNETIEYIGFVTALSFFEGYGEISKITLTISSLSKILQLTKVIASAGIYKLYESGKELDSEINIYSKRWSGWDPEEILAHILTHLFGCETIVNEQGSVYTLNIDTLKKKLQSDKEYISKYFTVSHIISYLLAKLATTNIFSEKSDFIFAKFLFKDPDTFKKWKVYNEAIRTAWEVWYSQLESPAKIFDDLRTVTFFELYEDRPMTIICKLPEYNNIVKNAAGQPDTNFIMRDSDCTAYNLSKNDAALVSRNDVQFQSPFIGTFSNILGGNYIDFSVLIKYGFRAPSGVTTNPNVKNQNAANLFAAILTGINNFRTRELTISVPDIKTYELGKLYVFPELTWEGFRKEILEKDKMIISGMVGYLVSKETSIKYGSVGQHILTFTFLRKCKIKLDDKGNITEVLFDPIPSISDLLNFTEKLKEVIPKQENITKQPEPKQFSKDFVPAVYKDEFYYAVHPIPYYEHIQKQNIYSNNFLDKFITDIDKDKCIWEKNIKLKKNNEYSPVIDSSLEKLKYILQRREGHSDKSLYTAFKAFPIDFFTEHPQQELVNRLFILQYIIQNILHNGINKKIIKISNGINRFCHYLCSGTDETEIVRPWDDIDFTSTIWKRDPKKTPEDIPMKELFFTILNKTLKLDSAITRNNISSITLIKKSSNYYVNFKDVWNNSIVRNLNSDINDSKKFFKQHKVTNENIYINSDPVRFGMGIVLSLHKLYTYSLEDIFNCFTYLIETTEGRVFKVSLLDFLKNYFSIDFSNIYLNFASTSFNDTTLMYNIYNLFIANNSLFTSNVKFLTLNKTPFFYKIFKKENEKLIPLKFVEFRKEEEKFICSFWRDSDMSRSEFKDRMSNIIKRWVQEATSKMMPAVYLGISDSFIKRTEQDLKQKKHYYDSFIQEFFLTKYDINKSPQENLNENKPLNSYSIFYNKSTKKINIVIPNYRKSQVEISKPLAT